MTKGFPLGTRTEMMRSDAMGTSRSRRNLHFALEQRVLLSSWIRPSERGGRVEIRVEKIATLFSRSSVTDRAE